MRIDWEGVVVLSLMGRVRVKGGEAGWPKVVADAGGDPIAAIGAVGAGGARRGEVLNEPEGREGGEKGSIRVEFGNPSAPSSCL